MERAQLGPPVVHMTKFDQIRLKDLGARGVDDRRTHARTRRKSIGPDLFSWIRHYVVEVCVLPSAPQVNKWIEGQIFLKYQVILNLIFLSLGKSMIHASKKEKTCSKILIACLRLLNPLVKIYFVLRVRTVLGIPGKMKSIFQSWKILENLSTSLAPGKLCKYK